VVSEDSTLYQEYEGGHVTVTTDISNKYLRLSGTSMAAAVTSGVIATMIEANRNLTRTSTNDLSPNTVKAILQFTSVDIRDGGIAYDELTQGAGAINAHGALQVASRVDTRMPVLSYWMTWEPPPTSTVSVTTSTPNCSRSQATATDVSSPPE